MGHRACGDESSDDGIIREWEHRDQSEQSGIKLDRQRVDPSDVRSFVRRHRGDRVADSRSYAHGETEHAPHQSAGFDHAAQKHTAGQDRQHADHAHRRDLLMEQNGAEDDHEDRRRAEKDRRQRQTQLQNGCVVTDIEQKLSRDPDQSNQRKLPGREPEQTSVIDEQRQPEQNDDDDHSRKSDRNIVESGVVQNSYENSAAAPANAGDDRECQCNCPHHSSHDLLPIHQITQRGKMRVVVRPHLVRRNLFLNYFSMKEYHGIIHLSN